MYLGPIVSRSFPSIGAANPQKSPAAENIAAVIAALPPNPCLRAGRNTGWQFLTPPSTMRFPKDRAKMTNP